MLKALLPLFVLFSFLAMGFAVAPASAGGIARTGYAKTAKIICTRTGCRPRFRWALTNL
jgi:hypothetical protein